MPVADSQLNVNRAASARCALYAGSLQPRADRRARSRPDSHGTPSGGAPGRSNAGDRTGCGAGGRPVAVAAAPAGRALRNAFTVPAPHAVTNTDSTIQGIQARTIERAWSSPDLTAAQPARRAAAAVPGPGYSAHARKIPRFARLPPHAEQRQAAERDQPADDVHQLGTDVVAPRETGRWRTIRR